MRFLRWSRDSVKDIEEQVEWIAGRDVAAARRMRQTIDERANWLAEFPTAGQSIAGSDTRSFHVLGTRYVIVYRVLPDAVEIARVHHERQNWR